ncbi:hypothetical protein DMN91_004643 [Ooceraea biroi]|uniref:Uncharacterized protein n=1 Tax=Ooceraea biroi TaxID=2015173 RepID=A0A3L8DPK0_OOCBI|nr:hypothetical protein DMN91_004643 [Ooceraea biroi]
MENKMVEDITSREQIEEYIANLERIRVAFERIQEEIYEVTGGEVTVLDSTEEAYFEDRHFETKVLLNRMLRNVPAPQSEAQSSASNEHVSRQASASPLSANNSDAIARTLERQTELLSHLVNSDGTVNQRSGVKLPAVRLPTFDGRTEEWQRFADTFRSLVHDKRELQPVQKFQYLVTSLTGDAARVIESIELTADNYAIAWDLLRKRYDDPRAIKKRHIECLFRMPVVKKESSSAIRGLIDYTMIHLRVLKAMELPTESWDELIVHMMETKLDVVTLRAWEQEDSISAVTLDKLVDFLQKRCQTLERLEARTNQGDVIHTKGEVDKQVSKHRSQKPDRDNKATSLAMSTSANKCYLCNGEHFLYHCKKFIALPVDERIKEVRRLKLCFNCLRNDHYVKSCKMGSCRECSSRHNTLCHIPINGEENPREENTDESSKSSPNSESEQVAVHLLSNEPAKRRVILATARVHTILPNGSSVPCRILLDSASEAHLITSSACNKIGVKRNRSSEIITGINELESQVHQVCDVLQSSQSKYRFNVHCLIVPKITKNLPSIEISREILQIPSNLKFADCEFDKAGPIDILIGAEYFYELLEMGKIELGKDRPILQNTKLGWVLSGPVNLGSNLETVVSLHCSIEQCESLNQSLERFWEIENCSFDVKPVRSETERKCEEFFERTTKRDNSGRFIVRLPIRENAEPLGESREIAEKRLKQLERCFKNNRSLQVEYVKFMREYESLGHISRVVDNECNINLFVTYLPHHCVVKESSSTTKYRAVFDASSKTTSGQSLNDILMVGPTLQSGLIEVMI